MLFFNAEEDTVSYGRAALTEYMDGFEGRLMRSLKSILGTGLMSAQTEVGGRPLAFQTILSTFINELKARGEQAAGRSFDAAVFGRPVHFVDDDTAADQLAQDTLADIARAAGFKEVEFQFEPIAAAFDYEQSLSHETLTLIVDIGGGTSDFSLLRLSPERAQAAERHGDILAWGGVHIGGTDFDRALSLAELMPLLGYKTLLKSGAEMPSSYYFNLATWHTINFVYTRRVSGDLQDLFRDARERDKLDRLFNLIARRSGHWLATQAEAAKIALSDADEHTLALGRIEEDLEHTIQRTSFEAAIAGLLDKIANAVNALLRDAGIQPDQVDTVYFTGGASGVPLLRAQIAACLPNAKHVEGDRFGSIGSGLAIDAARRFG
ncbi:Hsp70 family protein [Andreprevotia chitinilytica]|uniref:Hsp70 family protein n=1 Tax=Andreprevotia chitinilytica TaxID=396808 RepID=UPI000A619356|nr:Hsp70 family protein [Andreprevotia chitinilytica]